VTIAAGDSPTRTRALMRPWRFVVALGVVSLLADMVYEGARSIIGPYLATLGASAVVVGIVAGAGEFIGYGLRVVSGYAVRRTQHYWAWTITGYALTVLSVPLIGMTGALSVALALYGAERLGKAVRSPAKDTLLSYASTRTGAGSAFGVHQALDQTGAVLGPLVLAAMLAWHEGDYKLAFGVLAVPGVAVLVMLLWVRSRVPDPAEYEPGSGEPSRPAAAPASDAAQSPPPRAALPSLFWQYVMAIAVLSCGVASFPLIAYHAQTSGLLTDAQVPLVFALAMGVDGLSGPVVGRVYDRRGPAVLLAVPVAAIASAVAFTDSALLVWVGVAVWGIVNGVLDSTVKAVVATMLEPGSRAVAFGWLALVRGLGLLIAGAALGVAYDLGRTVVIAVIVLANAVAMAGLVSVLRRMRSVPSASP
jgi:MFS family permease